MKLSTKITLAAAAARLEPEQETLRCDLERSAAVTRRGIKQLRTLLVSIYPPNLHDEGLSRALEDLLAPVAGAGITTSLDCPPVVDLDADSEGLVYRTAQEALQIGRAHV